MPSFAGDTPTLPPPTFRFYDGKPSLLGVHPCLLQQPQQGPLVGAQLQARREACRREIEKSLRERRFLIAGADKINTKAVSFEIAACLSNGVLDFTRLGPDALVFASKLFSGAYAELDALSHAESGVPIRVLHLPAPMTRCLVTDLSCRVMHAGWRGLPSLRDLTLCVPDGMQGCIKLRLALDTVSVQRPGEGTDWSVEVGPLVQVRALGTAGVPTDIAVKIREHRGAVSEDLHAIVSPVPVMVGLAPMREWDMPLTQRSAPPELVRPYLESVELHSIEQLESLLLQSASLDALGPHAKAAVARASAHIILNWAAIGGDDFAELPGRCLQLLDTLPEAGWKILDACVAAVEDDGIGAAAGFETPDPNASWQLDLTADAALTLACGDGPAQPVLTLLM